MVEVVKQNENIETLSSSLHRKVIHLKELMVTVIEFSNGPMKEPDLPHNHPHEQITYVASGSLKFFIEDREYTLNEGDVIKIASNLNHSVQTLTEKVKLIDSFSPIRKDFLK
ncbi:cupin domain-containing protein [Seonamhaeicola aphaedonensis]|uniref:Quercetin dioxygenase-like cupin family protein n=1 Tax=Seonamhaeicola aphaedonensis TaxID=1461338 RepID=A0A3D9HLU6_9FLAO|nr:cupin domain-containing protein [Seonamhaeicola aphaedonensis]RED50467.1 quercetin dioxygenase-like cupin family protein [Seonamhaeicola aphaedonensis]